MLGVRILQHLRQHNLVFYSGPVILPTLNFLLYYNYKLISPKTEISALLYTIQIFHNKVKISAMLVCHSWNNQIASIAKFVSKFSIQKIFHSLFHHQHHQSEDWFDETTSVFKINSKSKCSTISSKMRGTDNLDY